MTQTTTPEGPTTTHRRRWWRRPAVLIPAAAVLAVGLVVGLVLFQPWKLVIDQRVDEALPTPTAAGASEPQAPGAVRPAQPEILATGRFISHEHGTSGIVRILELPDGQRILRIEDLDTSNGPDLKVWLADAPVIEGTDGWFVFDDGKYVSLGDLKGNAGNQNYPIPDSVDLAKYRSVSIWCERFHVSFGAAELREA